MLVKLQITLVSVQITHVSVQITHVKQQITPFGYKTYPLSSISAGEANKILGLANKGGKKGQRISKPTYNPLYFLYRGHRIIFKPNGNLWHFLFWVVVFHPTVNLVEAGGAELWQVFGHWLAAAAVVDGTEDFFVFESIFRLGVIGKVNSFGS